MADEPEDDEDEDEEIYDDEFLDAIFPRTLIAQEARSNPVGYEKWLKRMLDIKE